VSRPVDKRGENVTYHLGPPGSPAYKRGGEKLGHTSGESRVKRGQDTGDKERGLRSRQARRLGLLLTAPRTTEGADLGAIGLARERGKRDRG